MIDKHSPSSLKTNQIAIITGFTLIEVIFAIALSAAVAVIGIRHLQTPGVVARSRACETNQTVLQGYVQRHTDVTGRSPRRDLVEIRTEAYAGLTLPTCPSSGTLYELRRGRVICTTHPETL